MTPDPNRKLRANVGVRLAGLALAFIGLGALAYFLARPVNLQAGSAGSPKELKVLTYSAFLNSWGPGAEIAQKFEQEFGVKVIFQDAGDAGLLLPKLALFPSDVVLGLDQFSKVQAAQKFRWRSWPVSPPAGGDDAFTEFDRGAMTFVYRQGEIKPPVSLPDLLDARFAESISLEDPSTSTPGLQFFFWVLDSQGIDAGFEYLKKLKPNVRAVSPSWSSAYGLFTKKQSKLAFSYVTSPVYHWVEEKDHSYQPTVFAEGQPLQREFVAVPQTCVHCDVAHLFVLFLLRPEIQKLIMTKNYMLPVLPGLEKGSPFEALPRTGEYRWKNLPRLLESRDELLNRWRQLDL